MKISEELYMQKRNMTKLKTVQKWEKEYQIKLKRVKLPGSKVGNVQCVYCKEYEGQIMSSKNLVIVG